MQYNCRICLRLASRSRDLDQMNHLPYKDIHQSFGSILDDMFLHWTNSWRIGCKLPSGLFMLDGGMPNTKMFPKKGKGREEVFEMDSIKTSKESHCFAIERWVINLGEKERSNMVRQAKLWDIVILSKTHLQVERLFMSCGLPRDWKGW